MTRRGMPAASVLAGGISRHAFAQAMDAAPHSARQAIPVLTDAAPSAQLAAAYVHVDAIEFEVKPRTDGADWHRFRCTACGRVGTWLSAPEKTRANGMAHAQYHAGGGK